jgi:1,4-dihydroxy-6-naphthoate synthase
MPDARPTLILAHSPDPDDAFMWWPITGKITPPHDVDRKSWAALALAPTPAGTAPHDSPPFVLPGLAQAEGPEPTLDTGSFRFRALPADIEILNRRAIAVGDIDVTALSVRAYAEVASRYAITSCGASFGDGYGPKVVVRNGSDLRCDGCLRSNDPLIAVPGAKTTAFLTLGLLIGKPFRFVEMQFDRVIDAVARGDADAGLVIHEGQLTFEAAGLRQIADVGAWWKETTDLPLPLGVNAVRRDLDGRFHPGALAEVAATLRKSVRHAMDHRSEGIDHALRFAMANSGGEAITRERVEKFVSMYVNARTLDMGDAGRAAIQKLLAEGARAGLCPDVGQIHLV